ncbi:MAG: DUF3352 domain-containing protein [Flavobacteriales bacterium]|nr:DUF3352 domain-containing protein [Flavobacteriales bacterium]
MKKLFIVLIILGTAGVGGWLYWNSLQKAETSSDPVDAIPLSAAVVISYPDLAAAWEKFQSQDYAKVLGSVEQFEGFFTRNSRLDSVLRLDPEVHALLAGGTLWSSYHSKNDSLLVFYALQSKDGNSKNALELLKNAFSSTSTITEQQLGERSVFKIVFTDPYDVLFCSNSNGLVLASSDLQLLQESFSQLENGRSLREDLGFSNALEATGKNVEANVFINYAKLPEYLSRILKPDLVSDRSMIADFASWTVLDANVKSEGLTFNGFSYVSDSLPQFLSLFLNQQPQTISFPEILPSNTATFLFFGIEDAISFSSDYRELLNRFGKLKAIDGKLDSLNTLYGVDIEQNLLAWIGHSFGFCALEPQAMVAGSNRFLVFDSRSADLASKLLSDLGEALSSKNGIEAVTVDQNGVDIRQLALNGILKDMFGDVFDGYENPFYMVLDKHVVFGSTPESLTQYLTYIQADRTLAKELSFSRFSENLGSSFNVFSYHQLSRSKSMLHSYLSKEANSIMDKNSALSTSFEAVGTQLSTTGKSFYSNVFLKYNPDWKNTKESVWEAEMSGKAQIPPVFVTNHVSGEQEILVQDETNALYLFNMMGQQLFKVEISEPIESRPVQVDALKNGKLQYIFNTKNFIHLIDRDGNSVDGFPLELDSPAETELAVFDYDKNNDYRLLIACKNKHIYNFDIKGKPVSGWKHTRSTDPTVQPFKHLLVSGKDYLITGETSGKIHLLDRGGKNRVKVEKRVEPSVHNHLQVFKSSEVAFTGAYITDVQGKIYRIALDGDVQPMDLGKYSPEHYFFVCDLDKDGGPEFVFSDLNVLHVFNYKKQKVFEQRIDPTATAPFIIDLGDQGAGIGYCYKDPQQLVLFNPKGQMVEGFPLSGNSKFAVSNAESGMMVISAGNDNALSIQTLR